MFPDPTLEQERLIVKPIFALQAFILGSIKSDQDRLLAVGGFATALQNLITFHAVSRHKDIADQILYATDAINAIRNQMIKDTQADLMERHA